jgi:hypothetical protein
MQGNYSVQIEDFAERHFIKSFSKKHKSNWDFTLMAILAELARIDMLLLTDKAETILDTEDFKIIKTKFKIAGTQESAKTSGNRCIVVWYPKKQSVSVLLVYGKTDLSGGHETNEWKNLIRENYTEFKSVI